MNAAPASIFRSEGLLRPAAAILSGLVLFVGRPAAATPVDVIAAFAGNGVPSFSGDGGPATTASLNGSQGLGIAVGRRRLPGNPLHLLPGRDHRLRPGGLLPQRPHAPLADGHPPRPRIPDPLPAVSAWPQAARSRPGSALRRMVASSSRSRRHNLSVAVSTANGSLQPS